MPLGWYSRPSKNRPSHPYILPLTPLLILPTPAKPAIPKHTASFLVFTKGIHWPFLCMSKSGSFSSNALFAMKNYWFTPALTKTRLSSDLAQSFTSAFLVVFVMASIILEW